MSVERTREHTVDEDASSDNLLATLSEEQENRVQIDKIREFTVEPGLMKLPVSIVTKAENSEKWVLEVEHPIEGTLRMYLTAPVNGWDEENELVRTLNWYNINRDPYQLQMRHVYVRKDDDASEQAHGWVLTAPPDYKPYPPEPIATQLKAKLSWVLDRRPNRTLTALWFTLMAGSVVGGALTAVLVSGSAVVGLIISMVAYVASSIVAMILFDPPE